MKRNDVPGYKLGIWVQLQREFKRRKLLPKEAIEKLDELGMPWESPDKWLDKFGKIAFLFEKYKIEEK